METRKIPLTRGLEAIVDLEDYPRVAMYKWQAFITGSKGAVRARRQYREPGSPKKLTLTLANVILKLGPEHSVRHINGDSLDCRKANLEPSKMRGYRPALTKNTGSQAQSAEVLQNHIDPLDEEYNP